MKKSFSRKLDTLTDQININRETLFKINDLWRFDDQITAPLHGFDGAEDYYQQASAQPYLKHITPYTVDPCRR